MPDQTKQILRYLTKTKAYIQKMGIILQIVF